MTTAINTTTSMGIRVVARGLGLGLGRGLGLGLVFCISTTLRIRIPSVFVLVWLFGSQRRCDSGFHALALGL